MNGRYPLQLRRIHALQQSSTKTGFFHSVRSFKLRTSCFRSSITIDVMVWCRADRITPSGIIRVQETSAQIFSPGQNAS